MHTILLVENDLSLATALKQLLVNAEYAVKTASSLEQAYELLNKTGFELVIIDRLLDDGDGIELAGFLQEVSFGTKVLFLTQKNEVAERLEGLEQGADDYLGKPFETREFLLRVKLLLKRQKLKDQDYLQAGEVWLQPSSGRLRLADQERTIRKREAEILACLLRLQGTVVSKAALIEYVWQSQEDIPTYTTLEVYIRRLRVLLGKHHELIKTIRGFGYTISA